MMEITKEHAGHTITVGDETGMRFVVKGPIVDTNFGTFDEATNAIDDATKKHEAQERKRIAVRVLKSTGDPVTVTGIHAGNGSILGIGDTVYSGMDFYPDVPWIAETIKKRKALYEASEKLTALLGPFRMSRARLPTMRQTSHREVVDGLVKLIADMTAKAEAAAPKDEAA